MPPRPWPTPGQNLIDPPLGRFTPLGLRVAQTGERMQAVPQGILGISPGILSAAAGVMMTAVVDRIMENRPSPSPMLTCRTCGHEWGSHQDGRCAHLFGMEGDFAHVCGCSPDERGEVPDLSGMASVAAAAAAIIALQR